MQMKPIALTQAQSRLYLWNPEDKQIYTQVVFIPENTYPDVTTLQRSPDEYAPCWIAPSLPPYTILPQEQPELFVGGMDKHLPRDLIATAPLPHPKREKSKRETKADS